MKNIHIIKHIAPIILCFLSIGTIKAQEDINDHKDGMHDINLANIDFRNIQLPSLNVLFDNAKNNPSIAILEKEKQIQEILLSNKKKDWLSFFSIRGGYTHGVTDNYGTQTDILTPIFYQYSGVEQNYWNVGGNISIPIEKIFTIKGETRAQKLNIEKAQSQKEIAFDNLKQQIAHLYVQIQSNIKTLERSAEYLNLYKGASAVAEEEFKHKNATIDYVADTKRKEFEANTEYEKICSTINEQILFLEIISKTEILPK